MQKGQNMININQNYSKTSFGAKLSPEAYNKLKSNVSKNLNHCIDICNSRLEEWGEKDSIIFLEKEKNTGLNQYSIKNPRLGNKQIHLSFGKKNNELLSALISITKEMIISAEQYIKKTGSQ